MKSYTASDARRRFGVLLETVQREPVVITKNGRGVAMMLSTSDDSMIAAVEGFLEDRQWGERGGYIGVEESARILSDALNAEG